MDINNDGILTKLELEKSDENLSPEIIYGLFLVADTNNDNKITYNEYKIVAGAFDSNKPHRTSEVVFLYIYQLL